MRRFQILHCLGAPVDHRFEAGFRRRVTGFKCRLLALEDADDPVGFRQQFLQIGRQRHIAYTLGTHALHALFGEDADEFLHGRVAFHAFKLGAEHVGRILQPDDQVGNVAFHHTLLAEHVLDTGILNVEIHLPDGFGLGQFFQNDAGLLQLGFHFLDGLPGLFNFGVEILQTGHQYLPR